MNDNLAGDGVRRPVFDPQTGEQLVRPTFERIVRIDPPRRPEPAAGPRALWKFWLASLTIFFWMIWLGVGQYIDDWRATAILEGREN